MPARIDDLLVLDTVVSKTDLAKYLRDREGDLAHAALASSTRFIELDAAAWSNNTVRVMARNISPATFDLGSATLSVQVTKWRVP